MNLAEAKLLFRTSTTSKNDKWSQVIETELKEKKNDCSCPIIVVTFTYKFHALNVSNNME